MKKAWILIGLIFALTYNGCSQNESNIGADPTTSSEDDGRGVVTSGIPLPPGGSGFNANEFPSGATASFTVDSNFAISQFLKRPVNEVEDMVVNIDVTDVGGGIYCGVLRIAYTENNIRIADEFTSGDSAFDCQHNRFFFDSVGEVWHGFFRDSFGTVVVVVDEVTDLGDGASTGLVSGELYFKNFDIGPLTGPPPFGGSCIAGFGCADTEPWFVTLGPYETRTFLVGDEIDTTSAVYPSAADGFALLGAFSSLNRGDAFN